MLWQPFNTWLRIEFFNFKLLQNANSKLELYFPSFYKMENPLGYVVTDWFVVAGRKIPWAAELSAWLALLRFVVIVKKVPWDNLLGCHQSCLLALLPVQTTVHSIPLYFTDHHFASSRRFNGVKKELFYESQPQWSAWLALGLTHYQQNARIPPHWRTSGVPDCMDCVRSD